jgi:hypothetical protein
VRRSGSSRAGRTGFRGHGAGAPGSRRPAARSRPRRTVIHRLPARRHPRPRRRAAHRQHGQRRLRQRARPVPRPPGRRQGLLTRDRPPQAGPVQDRAPAASPAPRLPPVIAARCPPGRPLAPGLPGLHRLARRPGLGPPGPRLLGLCLPGLRPGVSPQRPRLPGLRLPGRWPGPRLPGARLPDRRRGLCLPGPRLPQRRPGLCLPVRVPWPRAAPGLTGRPAAHLGLRRPRRLDLPGLARAHGSPVLRSGPWARPA